MLSAKQLKSQLSHFTGTDNYYKHWLGFQYTDGIKFLADNAEAYWLLDAIASYQPTLRQNPRLRDFQLWLLVVGNEHNFIKPNPENKAVLTCWEDTPSPGVKPAVTQQIEYTDFPLQLITLYLENRVLLLPSER
ncbi:DUF6876 family protein [Aerosakkonemataceae cyanobacterium BLCC-F50]|uniref:DUF6876 family protein n=1 Tax=Floridaenema flaviceps BLCC-F50 TaxID=3153642 RepID=A0ABV4XLK1_9CYAN